jgi:cell division protein FtsQ
MTVLEAATRFTEPTRRRRYRRWLIGAGAVLLVGLAVWVVWFSPLLSVREVRVLGAVNVSSESVLQAAAVPAGVPLARVDVAGVTARVSALPRVASVEVRRGWPNVLVVVVTERVPLAVVPDAAGYSYLDATGTSFASVARVPRGLPVVKAASDDALRSAAAVVAALPATLRAAVSTVTAGTHDDIVLTLASGPTVRWGSAEQSDRKAAVLAALLKVKASSYDVSAPDLPTSTTASPTR